MSKKPRILLTGATGGIGTAVAQALAAKGAGLVLSGRNSAKLDALVTNLRREHGADAEPLVIDMASLAGVAEGAREYMRRFDALDVLINNAGMMAPKARQISADGLELTFAVNVLAPFVFTNELLPLVKRTGGRGISTSSLIANMVRKPAFADPLGLKKYRPFVGAYGQSKFWVAAWMAELARQLERSGVVAHALEPGGVHTPMFDHETIPGIMKVFGPLIMDTPEKAAGQFVYAALDDGVGASTGGWISKSKLKPMPRKMADADTGAKFWAMASELANLTLRQAAWRFRRPGPWRGHNPRRGLRLGRVAW